VAKRCGQSLVSSLMRHLLEQYAVVDVYVQADQSAYTTKRSSGCNNEHAAEELSGCNNAKVTKSQFYTGF